VRPIQPHVERVASSSLMSVEDVNGDTLSTENLYAYKTNNDEMISENINDVSLVDCPHWPKKRRCYIP
jgi:hypothetical protein